MLVLGACSSADTAAPIDAVPAAVVITDPGVIRDGDVVRLNAVVRTAGGATIPGATVQWTATDPSVATVTTDGLLTALREGTTELVAVAAGTSVQQRLVLPIVLHPATAIELSRTQIELPIGTQGGVAVTLRGLGGRVLLNRPIEWSASDPSVVQVSPTGVITPMKGGVVTVTVRYGTLSAALEVRVPTPVPVSRVYSVTSANGNALPVKVEDVVVRYPDGSTRRIITHIEDGTISIGASYDIALKMAWYEVSELNGNVILRSLGRGTLEDVGTVDYNWLTGTALLVSTRFGSLSHPVSVQGNTATLTYREPGTDNRYTLGLAVRAP